MPKRLSLLLTAVALAAAAVTTTPAGGQERLQVAELPAPEMTPAAAESFAFAGEEVTRTLADTWHRTGRTGEGVTIGVLGTVGLDAWREAAALHEVPPTASVSTRCRLLGQPCNSIWQGRDRSVGLIEVIHDMAPDADLALGFGASDADVLDVIDWFAQQGTDVLVRPYIGSIDGPGDGTGPTDELLDHAVAAGMTVIQAAGESADGDGAQDGGYYRWTFADEDDDGWVEFNAAGDERLLVTDCDGYMRGLRWDDFGEGASTTDYELYRFAVGSATDFGRTSGQQQVAAPPVESIEPCATLTSAELGVKLDDPGAAAEGDVLELIGAGLTWEYSTSEGSASMPGEDSLNPGVVTVGALTAPDSGEISPTSSRGPTTDLRANPDLTAASCLSTFAYTDGCVDGTDASAAVVAGAAALFLGENAAASPADVAAWLTTEAIQDRGPVGVDNAYGAGELVLPSMGPRARYRPDARIRGAVADGLVGNNRYNSTGANQGTILRGRPGQVVRFAVTLENDGNAPERFLVGGSTTAFGYEITYFRGPQSITGFMSMGRYSTPVVQPGRSTPIQVRVRIPTRPTVGGVRGIVQVLSQTTLRVVDTVRYNALVRS